MSSHLRLSEQFVRLAAVLLPRVFVAFALTEDIVAEEETEATMLDFDGEDLSRPVTVLDPLGIFTGGTSGSNGWAFRWNQKLYIVQLACPSDVFSSDAQRANLWN